MNNIALPLIIIIMLVLWLLSLSVHTNHRILELKVWRVQLKFVTQLCIVKIPILLTWCKTNSIIHSCHVVARLHGVYIQLHTMCIL